MRNPPAIVGAVDIHLAATIGTIEQTCEGSRFAPAVWITPYIAADFLRQIKGLLVDNGFMGILKDRPFILRNIVAFLVLKVLAGLEIDGIRSFSAVLQQSFRFAVSPKQYITFNPMQYIKLKYQTDEVDLFSDDDMNGDIQPIPREDYERLIEFLQDYNPPAILPIQIAYYAGLRISEACGLAWQDVNLEEQCLTIRRSIRYDGSRHKNIIGPTKRKKVRIVDFGDTLAEILRNARKEQLKNRMQYGELYHKNYYREVKDKNRVYYEFYHLDGTENVPEDYKEISFVCLRPDGSLELPSTLGIVCRKISQKLDGFEGFHFHQLRHTYTSNLLANGAAPKDVQELLGHSDVSTTMNVYAHSTRKAKRESAKLLDKVAGND